MDGGQGGPVAASGPLARFFPARKRAACGYGDGHWCPGGGFRTLTGTRKRSTHTLETSAMSAPPRAPFARQHLLTLALAAVAAAGAEWQPAKGPLMTRWAKDVRADRVHPEYPRPQMRRDRW